MRHPARAFVLAFLVFGACASLIGGFGFLGSLAGMASAHGCDLMMMQGLGVMSVVLAALGLLHLVASLIWLRDPRRGRSVLVALCVFNVCVNAAIAAIVYANEQPLPALVWIALIAVNLAAWRAVRRG